MKIQIIHRLSVVANFVALHAFLAGCGSFAGNPEGGDGKPPKEQSTPPGSTPTSSTSTSPSTTGGSISFSLTDAPIKDALSVFVTVESLEVSLTGDEDWIKIPLTTATEVDLLKFQSGKSTALAALSDLAPGTYRQTRLILAQSPVPRLIELDGSEHNLTIPSANTSGIKIMTPFTIEAGHSLNMTIDFDLRKSIKLHRAGNGNGNGNNSSHEKYMMNPVLRLVRDDTSGLVAGKGANGSTVCIYAKGQAKDDVDDCDQSESSAVIENGEFRVGFVPPGHYDVRIFPKDGGSPIDVSDVMVKSGEATDVGVVQ